MHPQTRQDNPSRSSAGLEHAHLAAEKSDLEPLVPSFEINRYGHPNAYEPITSPAKPEAIALLAAAARLMLKTQRHNWLAVIVPIAEFGHL
ncbi:hypothetical protein D3C71_1547710 [compost metagenome]